MRGACEKLSSSTISGSLRKGSMSCGASVGMAVSASDSERVRGETRTVAMGACTPSMLPPKPVRKVARPLALSRYSC